MHSWVGSVDARSRRRWRRRVGLLTLLALVVVVLGLVGVDLPRGSEEPPLPAVRQRFVQTLVRAAAETPPRELAFLAVEPAQTLLVTDRARRSVVRFDAAGRLLAEWGPQLAGGVVLGEPAGVAAAGDRRYVLDRDTPRILRLDPGGRLQGVIPLQQYGTYGLNGLAVDAGGRLYAADTGRNRILVLGPAGQFLRELRGSGGSLGPLVQPMALAFAPGGSLFVADWENARVVRFDPGLQPADAWPAGGRPFGIAVDALGRVFVPDAENRRVRVYTPRGTPLGELGGPGSRPFRLQATPRVAAGPAPGTIYVLGPDGVVRVEFDDVPALPAEGTVADPSLLALAAAAAAVGALLLRWQRRRARARRTRSGAPRAPRA